MNHSSILTPKETNEKRMVADRTLATVADILTWSDYHRKLANIEEALPDTGMLLGDARIALESPGSPVIHYDLPLESKNPLIGCTNHYSIKVSNGFPDERKLYYIVPIIIHLIDGHYPPF